MTGIGKQRHRVAQKSVDDFDDDEYRLEGDANRKGRPKDCGGTSVCGAVGHARLGHVIASGNRVYGSCKAFPFQSNGICIGSLTALKSQLETMVEGCRHGRVGDGWVIEVCRTRENTRARH